MDSYSNMIPTPFKYHEWKSIIGIPFCSKALYRVTLALENEPNVVIEKAKWNNRLDESYGLIFLSIYLDLIFHLYGLITPNQVWTKLESLFRVQDKIREHHLENDLFSLGPSSFDSIQGLFTKFQSLVLLLKQCGIEKKEDQLTISILSKLGRE